MIEMLPVTCHCYKFQTLSMCLSHPVASLTSSNHSFNFLHFAQLTPNHPHVAIKISPNCFAQSHVELFVRGSRNESHDM